MGREKKGNRGQGFLFQRTGVVAGWRIREERLTNYSDDDLEKKGRDGGQATFLRVL